MSRYILAYTDGFELSQNEERDYKSAYEKMKRQYDSLYDAERDDEESYISENDAKVVIPGEDIYLWGIHKCGEENEIVWKDIVKYEGRYYYFVVPVSLESGIPNIDYPHDEKGILKILGDKQAVYDCDNFFDYVCATLGANYDDIETYMFDDFDIPNEELERLKVNPVWLGGYINGFNI